jgi:hypothetical protein
LHISERKVAGSCRPQACGGGRRLGSSLCIVEAVVPPHCGARRGMSNEFRISLQRNVIHHVYKKRRPLLLRSDAMKEGLAWLGWLIQRQDWLGHSRGIHVRIRDKDKATSLFSTFNAAACRIQPPLDLRRRPHCLTTPPSPAPIPIAITIPKHYTRQLSDPP